MSESLTEQPAPIPASDSDSADLKRLVLVVFALALATRAAWAAAMPIALVSDSWAYDTLAKNLAEHGGYFLFEPDRPTAFWPVGGPALYALAYLLLGPGRTAILATNLVVGVSWVVLTAVLTRSWFGRRAAWVAGLALALWPSQIQSTTLLLSEPLFNLLLVLMLLGWGRLPASRPMLRGLALGPVMAALAYTRPIGALLPMVMAWCRLLSADRPRAEVPRLAVEVATSLAVMAVLIAPWTARNYRAFGQPVILQSSGGTNLWNGNHPPGEEPSDWDPAVIGADPSELNEAELSSAKKRVALDYIRSQPLAFLGRCARRVVLLHDRETITVVWNEQGLRDRFGPGVITPLKAASSAYWLAVLAAALVGSGLLLVRVGPIRWAGHPAIVLWGYFSAVYVITTAFDRYHFTSLPMVAALAGYAAAWLSGAPIREAVGPPDRDVEAEGPGPLEPEAVGHRR
ncbi:hypothetical protein [Tautonia sociabilis]|uniref:Glycosyltransferase RgtA/B/C/D-like domain-containing protein n=1 Tax=Tautonia sociabilis TaxID=2080755 RepID=A0A432MG86_9BACT|nr:hypothetical protein [Tautonia sociabilis]RUL85596.1 hypothetical protein TsocGM_17955 [Tautonia sociabilis]